MVVVAFDHLGQGGGRRGAEGPAAGVDGGDRVGGGSGETGRTGGGGGVPVVGAPRVWVPQPVMVTPSHLKFTVPVGVPGTELVTVAV